MKKEGLEEIFLLAPLYLWQYQQPIFYTDNAPLLGLHSMERGNQHHAHRRRN